MQFFIIAVGTRVPAWVKSGYDEYARRMPPDCKITLKEIKPALRPEGKPPESAMATEYDRIVEALPKNAFIIALDERGRSMTSERLSEELLKWQRDGRNVAFVIGGADGLDERLKKSAHDLLRLSDMTLPHGMARIVLVEQLYRAWSIAQHHPYHRH
ncbi:MAG: 23S rRNA (pseudouridine(1915)-N(3))-methyltransferase RlmH [Burkholderiaceae bacterium]|jgi:23S rRNA (pseudouridine1915-N3)-methyltransferase|nr:23S rRNA (pseudouridine(1915)-N(3))-methyltransferase RlmH [Burkholderiaceae bacterium]